MRGLKYKNYYCVRIGSRRLSERQATEKSGTNFVSVTGKILHISNKFLLDVINALTV